MLVSFKARELSYVALEGLGRISNYSQEGPIMMTHSSRALYPRKRLRSKLALLMGTVALPLLTDGYVASDCLLFSRLFNDSIR